MLVALTRSVPPSIDRCELTHLQREPIDYARAVEQHRAYEEALRRAGFDVRRLPPAPEHPDSVFVEDTAVVLDGVAVIARPGAESRRGEVPAVAEALREWRRLSYIQSPGTLDGGDVLVTPRRIFVGISGRTNPDGARQLAAYAAPFGFETVPVPVTGCLHLKSAVTCVAWRETGPSTLLINPAWVDAGLFGDFDLIEADPSEPGAANALLAAGRVICAAEHPLTRRRLDACGLATLAVPAGELAKAEGGLTCGSLLIPAA